MAPRFASTLLVASLVAGFGTACSTSDKGGGATGTGAVPANGATSGNAGGQTSGGSGQGGASGNAPTAGGSAGANSGGAQSGGAGPSAGGTSGTNGGSAGSSSGGTAGTGSGGTAVGTGGFVTTSDGGMCCTTRGCQPASVQSCVCDTWQLGQCCTGVWDTFCQTTAEQKCQADHCLPDPTGNDAGVVSTKGACCATHATPGCEETATEQCVCQLLPDCCDKQWDSVCVQLVREKHCEPGVRDCVCMTWQQSSCCDTQWIDVCKVVAEDKCMAKPSCP